MTPKPKRKLPHYQQYLPQEDLDALRGIAKATGVPYQVVVRRAIKVVVSHYRTQGVI